MKVYVLLGCEKYDGDTVLAVFATRESAEAARLQNGGGFDSYEIEEFTVMS